MATPDTNQAAERNDPASWLAVSMAMANLVPDLLKAGLESEGARATEQPEWSTLTNWEAFWRELSKWGRPLREKENASAVFVSIGPPDTNYLVKLPFHHSLSASIGTEETVADELTSLRLQNGALRSQVEILQSQVEMLKSRVAQECRSAAKAIQLHEQLQAHHDSVQNKMLDGLKQRDDASNVLQAALVGKADGRLRMAESYLGEVIYVSEDCVVVVFDVEGELVEQTYNRKQFLDGRLPEKRDRLAAYVHIAKLPAEEEVPIDGITASDAADKPRKPRKNIVPIPRTF